jgi:hypothetical protein
MYPLPTMFGIWGMLNVAIHWLPLFSRVDYSHMPTLTGSHLLCGQSIAQTGALS